MSGPNNFRSYRYGIPTTMDNNSPPPSAVIIVAELLILIMFLLSGLSKLLDSAKEVPRFQMKLLNNHGIAIDDKLAIAVILLAGFWELSSVMAIAYAEYSREPRWGKWGSMSLFVFTILATIIFYFPPDVPMKYYPFISNVNTLGGLLLLANKFNLLL